jgi:hypothetical protein
MQVFRDKMNRDWTLSLNIGTAMLVKDKLGIDILQPEVGEPPLLTRLGTDEMLLAQVIAILLESQFEKYNIDAEQIYQSFDGLTFAKAHEAFYKELIDFFQSRGRHDRSRAVEKQMQMILAGVKAAETKIENININEVIETAMNGVTFGV